MAPEILLVEDDPDIRVALAELLEEEGFGVMCAADGAEALALLRERAKPQVILLDLMMPNMSGQDFRAAQLRDPAIADIPTLVLSADGKATDKARQLGVLGAVKKPIELDELIATLRRLAG